MVFRLLQNVFQDVSRTVVRLVVCNLIMLIDSRVQEGRIKIQLYKGKLVRL